MAALTVLADADAVEVALTSIRRSILHELEVFELEIRAPVGAVWEVLTTGEELERWISVEAHVEPGAGGRIVRSWGAGQVGYGRIDAWEPERRLLLAATDEAGSVARLPMLEEWAQARCWSRSRASRSCSPWTTGRRFCSTC